MRKIRKLDFHALGSDFTVRPCIFREGEKGASEIVPWGGGGSLQTVAGRKLLPAPSKSLILRYLKISTQGIVEICRRKGR